jgi:C-terminal processing protease CtpA/Prc
MRNSLVMLFTALLVAGCGSSSDDTFTGEPSSCSNDGQKQFVLDALYDWYLWNADLPANISIAAYASPEALVREVTQTYGPQDANGNPVDRFSSVGSLQADQQFFGEGKYEGFGVRYRLQNDEMAVTGVFPDSPADAAGIARGQTIFALNGRTTVDIIASGGVAELVSIFDNNDTVLHSVRRLDNSTFDVPVTKAIVTIGPIPQWRAIDIGEGVPPVGYIEFASFISTAEPVFATVFAEFAAANVTDVIIDMRYNGGGLIRTAELLGDYLGSVAHAGEVFSRTEFNADRAPANNTTSFFASPAVTNGISTSRFIVIASRGTASASELVTNSLIPYADVWIVGENTFGKPVGQVGIEFCDKILRPTSFRTTNALGDGDYFDGLPVDCPAEDDLTVPVGADNDPRLVAALSVAQTGACPPSPAAASLALEAKAEPRALFLPSGGNVAREFAGAF